MNLDERIRRGAEALLRQFDGYTIPKEMLRNIESDARIAVGAAAPDLDALIDIAEIASALTVTRRDHPSFDALLDKLSVAVRAAREGTP